MMKLRNIGERSAAWLRDIGVEEADALRALGAPAAYRMVKSIHPQVNFVFLYALEGAIQDRHWNSLSDEEKERLQREANGIRFAISKSNEPD